MAKKPKPANGGGRLIPPQDAVVVRMYRIGHGDCFLLAFPGKKAKTPSYVLIDCGYKPGSPGKIKDPRTAKEITAHIREATGGHIDVAVITHEHQDHVNAITATHFKDITIGEAWFAWTEDPDDSVADELRKTYKDKLLGLLAARNRLAADGETGRAKQLDNFLGFELGGDDETFNANAAEALLGAAKTGESMNKRSMKLFKDLAEKGPKFLRAHGPIRSVPNASGIRVFALGPPRDPEQLRSLDPEGDEAFHLMSLAAKTPVGYFGMAAIAAGAGTTPEAPFASRFCVPLANARAAGSPYAEFVQAHYGNDGEAPAPAPHPYEVPGNAPWRRIDRDWLFSAEQLALDMNKYTNNSSLVLAFELSPGGKVLLFAADAQRGNWLSWAKKEWKDGDRKVSARDLLSRTVLYKVGHHGSHNATLNGTADDDYPNIAWMAQGDHGREFTAMITAVREWAETQDGWDHPLKAIKDALLKKSGGRVFQTDTDFEDMEMHANGAKADWKAFQSRASGHRLYFDYTVPIE
ncbi:MAG TPA: hypothetical protein VMN81_06405 [Vicinamibacterales bacterium]|nr:hypothetical protein [Vicinamibacterales bacterium]